MNKGVIQGQLATHSDRLNQIASFVGVAEKSSFSDAAAEAGTNASTLSRRISKLEAALGVRLLNRTTRQVSLTEPGRLYYQECQHILESVAAADAMVSAFGSEPIGRLRISAPVAFGRLYLAKTATKFLSKHTNVHIELNLTDRVVDLIAEEYDLAIRIGQMRESGLVARKLTENRRVLVAAPSYLKAFGVPRSPADLTAHNCIQFLNYSMRNWEFSRGSEVQQIAVGGNFSSDSSDTVYGALLAGCGIGLLAEYMCHPQLKKGELVQILPDWCPASASSIYAVFPSSRHLAQKVRTFIDLLASDLRGQEWPRISPGDNVSEIK